MRHRPTGERCWRSTRDGERREWSFGEVAERSARLAGTLRNRGIERGDVVMTLIGNRPEWVLTMVACFRIGAVALPCSEQLRAKDLRLRLAAAAPKLIVADERNEGELSAATTAELQVALIPDETLFDRPSRRRPVELAPTDPCLITFTSGTTGEAKGVVHGQRYLPGPAAAGRALARRPPRRPGLVHRRQRLVEVGAQRVHRPLAQGAAALLHDARFDPFERLEVLAAEQVNVLCMAPTEYRVIAKRAELAPVPALRGLVAAGEALNPEVLRAFKEGTGLEIRDGYGQTETGQLTGMPAGAAVRPGSMGRPLPGVRARGPGRRTRADRPQQRPDVLRRLPRRRARPRAGAVAHRRSGHAATRTATCTSRAAPTT